MSIVLLSLVLAGSPLTTHGVDESVLTKESLEVVTNGLGGGYSASSFSSKPLKALDGKTRAELVLAGLGVVKAYLSSSAAHQAWGRRQVGAPPEDPEVTIKQFEADAAKSRAEAAEQLASAPKDQQALLKQNLTQMEKVSKELVAQMKSTLGPARTQYKQQLTEYDANLAVASKGLDAKVKSVLTKFLAETKNMPFDAKLTKDGVFVDKTLESKDGWWKACWRAGKEPVEAARGFATSWAAELK